MHRLYGCEQCNNKVISPWRRTMDNSPLEACLYAALLMVQCVQVQCEQSCDQTEFLHPNGTCVVCPACGPGEQLSEDCGFGDGGEGVCVPCAEGKFSSDKGVAPCRRCTRCNLLNRLEKTGCSPTSDALCGQCPPGFYELRSMTGEVELSCVSCYSHDTVHKECLLFKGQGSKAESDVTVPRGNYKEPEEKRVNEEDIPVVLIGSATASSIFLVALLLWAFLLTAERFKPVPEYRPGPEGLLSAAELQCTTLSSHTERKAKQSETPSHTAEDSSRGLISLRHENEMHPTSIVINLTTNIKPSSQKKDDIPQEERQSSRCGTEEVEQKLQTIWDMAQGHGVEMLDYDSVQDLSLLLDSAHDRDALSRLGRSLGVPPQVIAHLQGFQDLFQYLRTSTYTLLPQLAQAAALLPNPEVVARIHRAVVNN